MTELSIPKNIKNIIGKKYGRLIVVSYLGSNRHQQVKWGCLCKCGNKATPTTAALNSGKTKSCGCLQKEVLSTLASTHKMSKTSEYKSWSGMIQRCTNKKNPRYASYGGRGIKVCDKWTNSFELFFQDIGNKPSPKHSIDRINNNKGYNPENCRWATNSVQVRNRNLLKINKSGVTGVYYHKVTKKWAAQIATSIGNKRHLGVFINKIDAVIARKMAEYELNYLPNQPNGQG